MKKTYKDLAIFGGQPEFLQPLHVGRPNTGDREAFLKRVEKIIDSGYFTNNGPCVQELERRLAELLEVEHVVAVCNGTLALELAVRALELKGEVIVPALTFVATAHALFLQGVRPVFCDADPATHNLDPRLVEQAITPRTSGILGVHLWGRPCEVEALEELARRYNLALFYDAAHAFACSWKGRMVGGFGQAEIFSFHATKFFHTLEGGAVATADGRLAERLRLLRNFGFTGLDQVAEAGTNAKMNEVSAAMGLTLLDDLDKVIATNARNQALYREGLADLPGICMVTYDPQEKNNFQYVVLEIDPELAGISRDRLNEVLWAENVRSRRYFYPGVHRMEPYRTLFPECEGRLPVTERLAERLLSLPNGTSVAPADIRAVCSLIRTCVEHVDEIRAFGSPQPSTIG